jgi:uncharacterized protein (TIGR02271 family)
LAHEERREESTPIEDLYSEYTVYDTHYEKIGKIDDLFVDESDQPEYVGVKMGFLGSKTTLIPVDIVRVNDKRRLVEVAADKETVKNGPTFSDDREITSEFERQVLDYYRVETRQASMESGAYGAYYPDVTGGERIDLRPGEGVGGAMGSVDRGRPVPLQREGASKRGSDCTTDEDEIRVQRSEEELVAGTRERQAGGVNVRKRVRTDRKQLRVPKRREEVSVERVLVQEGQPETSETQIGDDEIRIPIVEEEIVVEKRPVVKEEIRLRKEVIEEDEVVEEDVRKEEIDIDDQTERRGRQDRRPTER